MPKLSCIQVANFPMALEIEDHFSDAIEAVFHPYETDMAAEYRLRVNGVQAIAPNAGHRELSLFNDRFTITSDAYWGYMDLSQKTGQVDILPNWFAGALANFLRNLCSALIYAQGGLMLHAAGIVKDDQAYVFFGPSGSGKTTVVNHSDDYSILTDELVGIRQANGAFTACGTADIGRGVGGSYNIKGLFKLVKDREVYLKQLSHQQAMAEIFTLPQFHDTLLSVDTLLDTFLNLVKCVPCYELHFLPDHSFWRCIDEHVGETAAKV